MRKRVAAFFAVFMLLMFLMLMNVYGVSTGAKLAETADRQSTYILTVARGRGTVYDDKMRPLTGTQKEYVGAVVPTVEAASALADVLPKEKMSQVYPLLTKGKPFAVKLPSYVAANGVDTFEVDRRYSQNQLAANVIGYLDGSGKGVAGIEKAYQNELSAASGEISVYYRVDAVNRVLQGEKSKVVDTYAKKNSGVVLTIDSEIQKLAEQAAKKHLKKGAVVVTEVSGGEIRALVSVPSFSPDDVASALKNADSPLLNRALSAYNVGSVFKLVSAAAALENGVSPDTKFECTGGINVGGGVFHCFNGEKHGVLNMQEAIAKSCNTYFIRLMQQVPNESFLEMACSLGFGKAFQFAPGYSSAAGALPKLSELMIPRALANFSFGQGSLTATPVQISGLINAIAAKGEYVQPYLVKGLVDENGNETQTAAKQQPKQVMSQSTAALLRQFMAASVDHGTSQKGKPDAGGAGAKTGTAQTGEIVDGREIVQAWYAGFYPLEEPRYSIVVLAEDGEGGGSTCAPVFKEITSGLLSKMN